MAEIWLPGFKRVHLGLSGGPYSNMTNPKLGWHTTEGSSLAGARAAFKAFPPHLCYDPVTDEAEQYVPLNKHSYAFNGDANDRAYVIQVEVVGFASKSHTWSDRVCQRLAKRVVRPVSAAVGVPPVVVSKGFHGEGEGIVLATTESPIRLSLAQVHGFAGHLGHQHMPPPNDHWDPGRMPIQKILDFAEGVDMPLSEEDLKKIESIVDRKMRQGVRYIDNGDPDSVYQGHTTKKIRDDIKALPNSATAKQVRDIVREELARLTNPAPAPPN